LLEAGKELGLEYREDVNDLPPGHKDCIGWCQQARGRRRASTARTYLHPALKRPNLQLVTNALVHRIVFDGKRATGIEFSRGHPGGPVERAEAGHEVILSAGPPARRTSCNCPVSAIPSISRRSEPGRA
jgi:choline dehydrogenase